MAPTAPAALAPGESTTVAGTFGVLLGSSARHIRADRAQPVDPPEREWEWRSP